jgi:hypothetical protein
MPNIEIHGLHGSRARNLRDRIFSIFQKTAFADEIVVTIYRTDVQDVLKRPQPFIRLWSCRKDSVAEIIKILKEFGLDIEHVVLKRFILKKQRKLPSALKEGAQEEYEHS